MHTKNIKQNMLFGIVGVVIGVMVTISIMDVATPSREQSMNTHDMSMSGMMQDMTSGLAGKTGDAFDQAFLAEMIVHHQGAVAMAQQVLATSKRPELLKLANDIIAAQTTEIKMMQDWQKAWMK